MQDDIDKELPEPPQMDSDRKLSGFSQFIVGELETIGGVLTGDPLTQAEGEFNVEVGTVREEIEEDLADQETKRESAE